MSIGQTPACPTSEQCSAKARVEIPGRDVRAHAVCWPQMGGYSGRAVITVTDCATLWLWHDGQFPIKDDQAPREIHLCDPQQWIDVFQWLKDEFDKENNDGAEPDIWDLPEGVTLEEAEEVYRKVIDWGLLEDPRGTEIRTYDKRMSVRMPCVEVPCPPFRDVKLDVAEIFDWKSGLWHAPGEVPEGAPDWRKRAWDTNGESGGILGEADRMLRAEGIAYSEFLGRFMPVAVEVDPDSPAGRAMRAGTGGDLSIAEPLPTVEQALAEIPFRHAHEEVLVMPTGVTLRQWGDYPYGLADSPLVVGVPEGFDPVAVSDAVALCQSLGLLPGTPHGMLFVPEEMEPPEEG